MPSVRKDAAMRCGSVRFAPEGTHQRGKVPGPEPAVHFGNQVRKLFPIALGKAAEHEETADFAGLLAPDGFQDGLDGLFLGVPDEAAGIDQLDIHGAGLPFRHDLISIAYLVKEMFRIHGVLGTPQRDDLQGRHYSAS